MMLGMSQNVHQGLVTQNGSYRSIKVSAPLHHWISCFWQLDVEQGSYVYRSVADNCVDWITNLFDPAESFVVSPFTAPVEFPLCGPVSYFGIRFRILGYQGLTQLPLGEWSSASETIMAEDIVMPELLERIQAISYKYNASQFDQRCRSISQVLLASLRYPVIDRRLMHFLNVVNNDTLLAPDAGKLKCIEFGSSHRHVRRLSQVYLGLSMKNFLRVARFQKLLHQMQLNNSNMCSWSDYYFDQSHFIREFKYFTGTTPSHFRNMSFLYNP